MTEQEYLEQRLDDQLNWYSRRARSNRRWYHWLRISEIVIAASIPFFASLLKDAPALTIVIGVMSIFIVVISGLLALYKFQRNWIEYRTTAETLKHEKFLFLTRSPPYDIAQPFALLVERIEALLAREGTGWAGYIRQAAPSGEQRAGGSKQE